MGAHLYAILAREADTAVVFRRGPKNRVCLIKWDLKKDKFEVGQWLVGKIYEQKADLSPNGELLVYFAAKHWRRGKDSIPTWVAVSRPPYLTALVLWRGMGTWNEISLFESNNVLELWNYRPDFGIQPSEGFTIPKSLHIKPVSWSGSFYKLADHRRLVRDGWVVQEGDPIQNKTSNVTVYRKNMKGGSRSTCLQMEASYEKRQYSIHDQEETIAALDAEWADTRKDSVLYSQAGKLFRLKIKRTGKRIECSEPKEIADFTDMKFEAIESPAWAKK